MNIYNKPGSAINRLLADTPPGIPMTSQWLYDHEITPQMLWGYKKSGWLEPLGRGAWIRPGQEVAWYDAVFALQLLHEAVHVWPAARSALSLLGQAHYVPQGGELPVQLCVTRGYRLPDWMQRLPSCEHVVKLSAYKLFNPQDVGIVHRTYKKFQLSMSTPERAMLELCSMTPEQADPEEVKQLMQGLPALRPQLLQTLLLACRSIKAKRLFMVLAEIIEHPWLTELDLTDVDLGAGKRSLSVPGQLHPQYQITIPADWSEHEGHDAD